MDVEDCINKGYLQRFPPDKELVRKEMKESGYDLRAAKTAIKGGDFKWSVVKSYYSMFHAAKALLFSIGLKERRHFAIAAVLEDMYKKGRIQGKYLYQFSSAMSAREDADYRYTYSEETAVTILKAAEDFAKKMKSMSLKPTKPSESL
jgi:uncharacterized protein (UPF0332 family)